MAGYHSRGIDQMFESEMNPADLAMLSWLQVEINSGKVTIAVPAILLEFVTREGLAEARRVARLARCELIVNG